MIQIRKAAAYDIEFITDTLSGSRQPGDKLLSNLEHFLICESGRVKCGCGCVRTIRDICVINWLIVTKDNRGQKLGSAILKALLNIADLSGAKVAYAPAFCEGFLKSLKFTKSEKEAVPEFTAVFGPYDCSNWFEVSLEGYFKSCSQ
ncbi:MAG: GNAT family N-acetyltransferase [Caulobacteraceae bacterium]